MSTPVAPDGMAFRSGGPGAEVEASVKADLRGPRAPTRGHPSRLAALLLAAIGLYGVPALAVRERTHELGVRKALGASRARLCRDVLGDALATTLVGIVAGVGATLLVSRLLVDLLFEISPVDPATLLGVCALLLAVAVVAAYLPARRAARIDPMRALRAD